MFKRVARERDLSIEHVVDDSHFGSIPITNAIHVLGQRRIAELPAEPKIEIESQHVSGYAPFAMFYRFGHTPGVVL